LSPSSLPTTLAPNATPKSTKAPVSKAPTIKALINFIGVKFKWIKV
jgi:hypothetical protein